MKCSSAFFNKMSKFADNIDAATIYRTCRMQAITVNEWINCKLFMNVINEKHMRVIVSYETLVATKIIFNKWMAREKKKKNAIFFFLLLFQIRRTKLIH